MKLLVLGGFLGSGKTTVLIDLARHIIEDSDKRTPVAIIENEVGEVGVDDKILRADGYNVREMFSGCACCTLQAELPVAVKSIEEDLDPEWGILEPTGLAIPASIKKTIEDYLGIEVHVSAVVDAKRWRRMRKPLEQLLVSQTEIAEVILVNKVDLVDQDEVEYVIGDLRALNPDAEIVPVCARDGVAPEVLDKILAGGR